MKLNKEQQKLVEDNEKLIYGFMKKFNLKKDDWYDLLAMELCNTVLNYDLNRGRLSTYYYTRAYRIMCKEFKKRKTLKRSHVDYPLFDEYTCYSNSDSMDNHFDGYLDTINWIKDKNDNILNLRAKGYSQDEIAHILGITQVSVSRHLKKVRDEFNACFDR